jgi:hypothetical protein
MRKSEITSDETGPGRLCPLPPAVGKALRVAGRARVLEAHVAPLLAPSGHADGFSRPGRRLLLLRRCAARVAFRSDEACHHERSSRGRRESITRNASASPATGTSRRGPCFAHSALLVVDEIGYLPITRTGAMHFFQLITRRYEHATTVLTSNNKFFDEWGEVFGDEVISAALIESAPAPRPHRQHPGEQLPDAPVLGALADSLRPRSGRGSTSEQMLKKRREGSTT